MSSLLVVAGGLFAADFSSLTSTLAHPNGSLSQKDTAVVDDDDDVVEKQPEELPPPPSTNASLPLPLIIGAGQGTTGTHTAFCATCLMGIASVHFIRDCDFCNKKGGSSETTTKQAFWNDSYYYHRDDDEDEDDPTRKYVFWPHSNRRVRNKHPQFKVVERLRRILKYLGGKKGSFLPPPETNNMEEWAEQTKALIDEVIRWTGDETTTDGFTRRVDAVHDTPYTDVLPYVIESAKKHRGGLAPILLLTERNPMEWSKRRTKMHTIFLCRLDIPNHPPSHTNNNITSSNEIDLVGPASNNSDTATTTSHFDLFACIDRTVRAKKERLEEARRRRLEKNRSGKNRNKRNPPRASKTEATTTNATTNNGGVFVTLDEVFTAVRKVVHEQGWEVGDVRSHIAASFASHQAFWSARADVRWNVFEQTATVESIARDIQSVLSSSPPSPMRGGKG